MSRRLPAVPGPGRYARQSLPASPCCRTSSSRLSASRASAASRITSAQPLQPIFFGEISWRTRSTRISAPPPGIESSPAALEPPERSRAIESLDMAAIWVISAGEREWFCTCGKRCLISRKSFFEPVDAQIGMKPPLHQQLGAADRPPVPRSWQRSPPLPADRRRQRPDPGRTRRICTSIRRCWCS